MGKLDDGVVGAMAMDIAKRGSSPTAVRLLREATSVIERVQERRYGYNDTKWFHGLVLELPLDFMDVLDDGAREAIAQAAARIAVPCDFVEERLAPAAKGWRDRLAELEDWGGGEKLDEDWAVINERVYELRALYARAATPDERADVGRRCRELLIAASSATFRPAMATNKANLPKDGDAKAKCKLIVAHLGDNSLDDRMSKLIDRTWDLAVGLSHHDEPSKVATYAAAQATILVVRTLAVIEGELRVQE